MWGLNQVAIKVATSGISPLFQAGVRCGLAAVLLALWARWRGIPLFKPDGAFWPGVTVGALLAGNFVFIGIGLELTDASRGILFLYAAPFLVAVGAHVLIPSERLTSPKVLGLIAAFAGLALSSFGGVSFGGTSMGGASTGGVSAGLPQQGPFQTLGDAYCFIGAVFWAATTLVVRTTVLRSISPEKILFYQLVVATPLLLCGAWLFNERGITQVTLTVLVAFTFSTIVVVFVSYLVWFWLLHTYPAADVSVFTFLAPVFGVLSGYLLLNEQITWVLVGALFLIAIGIALVARPASKPQI
jgi:drug/metabolite transporter (DMT)-like permease